MKVKDVIGSNVRLAHTIPCSPFQQQQQQQQQHPFVFSFPLAFLVLAGGPAIVAGETLGEDIQVGITSFGRSCSEGEFRMTAVRFVVCIKVGSQYFSLVCFFPNYQQPCSHS